MVATKLVEKESIDREQFLNAGLDDSSRNEINKKLFDAMMLGNGHHHKVNIEFQTEEGQKSVFTTVWATTDNYIILKGGKYIPINSILSVHLD
jgi:hypothetical protein